MGRLRRASQFCVVQRVALDLNPTHILNVIMTRHHQESMPTSEIVYQTLFLYFRMSLLVLVPSGGMVLWKRHSPWMVRYYRDGFTF